MGFRWHVELISLQSIEVGNKGFNNTVNVSLKSRIDGVG